MALSYRANLFTRSQDPADTARGILESQDDLSWHELAPPDSDLVRFQIQDRTAPDLKLNITIVPVSDGSTVLVERRHPLAVQEVDLIEPPKFVSELVDQLDARIAGSLPAAGFLQEDEIEDWLVASKSDGQAVLVVRESSEDTPPQVLQQAAKQIRGMAGIGSISRHLTELCLEAVERDERVNPGAIIYLGRRNGEFDSSIAPAMMVSRYPDSSIRRNHRLCLIWQSLLELPPDVAQRVRELTSARLNSGRTQEEEDVYEDLETQLTENESLDRQLAEQAKQFEDLMADYYVTNHELQNVRSRLYYREKRLRELESYSILQVEDEDAHEVEPDSCTEAVSLACELLTGLEIRGDMRRVAELDKYPKSQIWAQKIWSALFSLNSFTKCRSAGEFDNNFFLFCDNPPMEGVGYYANHVAMVESDSTNNDPYTREVRTFSVPPTVQRSGSVYMPAHIKIDGGGSPAPRIHFYDDTSGSGKVYVGYIGEHLPTGG